MPRRNGQTRLLDAHGRPYRWDYDAVEDKKRRQAPRIRLLSEDRHLPADKRRKLVATARDVVRNWTLGAFLVRKHLDYVSRFTFQSRTGQPDLDGQLERLVKAWSKPRAFDAAGRHSLRRFVRLAEARRTLDGDLMILKLGDGRVQAIESDRIRTPTQTLAGVDANEIIHGVVVDGAGAPLAYCLHNRSKLGDGFEFDRLLPARYVVAHGYYDRFDQVRGISPMAPGLNTLQDVYETFEYVTAKSKLAQLFGVVLKRSDDEAIGDVTTATDDEGNLDKSATEVDWGRGPWQLDLGPEDSLDLVESEHPPQQLLELLRLLVMVTMKILDVPFSWFDEANTNYSGQRQAWLLYDQSADEKREDNRELLNTLLAWRIGLWVLDGELVLPAGFDADDLAWEWIARAIPWIDPLKEIKADEAAIANRLISRERICKRLGNDFFEVADELAAEEAYLRQLGLSTAAGGLEPEEEGALLSRRAAAHRRGEHVAHLREYRHGLPA